MSNGQWVTCTSHLISLELFATVQVLPQPTAPTGTFTNHRKFLFIGITLEDTNFGDLMCR